MKRLLCKLIGHDRSLGYHEETFDLCVVCLRCGVVVEGVAESD